jgi:hypothetical protein
MKLTVGSLPAAVYWRRRAVVLGILLVVIIIFWSSCTGPSKSDAGSNKTSTTSSSSPSASSTPSATPAFVPPTFDDTPTVGPSSLPSATATAQPGTGTDGAGALPACADSDLSLIAAPEVPSAPNGAYLKFMLKIKNISGRPCTRDLGADHQELYLQTGTTKAWSSDVCSPAHGSETVTMQPNIEHLYSSNWNGQASNNGCTNRKAPGIGKYELFARLDTKISAPAAVQLT